MTELKPTKPTGENFLRNMTIKTLNKTVKPRPTMTSPHLNINVKSNLLRTNVNVKPRKHRLAVIVILLIGILCLPARSKAFCFKEAGQIYNVPPQLLWTIAKVESDFNPLAINFRSNTDYDFGLMQIHTSWARKLGSDVWQSLGDPCQNVKVGAWILAQCIRQHGLNWKGIGCYNAVSENKQIIYAKKVISILNQLKYERN